MSRLITSIFKIFLLSLFWGSTVHAQNASTYSSASFYSSYGIGNLGHPLSGIADGMGLNGVAIDQLRAANFSNPALLGFYNLTTGAGIVDQSLFTGKDAGGSSAHSDFSFKDVGLIFPIQKSQLSISLALTPLSYVRYSGNQEQNMPSDTIKVLSKLNGSGGISEFKMGVGYVLTDNISLGYAPSLIFGEINKSSTTIIGSSDYNASLNGLRTHYSGMLHEFGLIFHKNELLSKEDRIVFGTSFRLPAKLNVQSYEDVSIFMSNNEIPAPRELPGSEIELPFNFKAGLSYYINSNWLFASDLIYEPWSGISSPSNSYSYSDRLRVGFGGLYSPTLRNVTGFFGSLSLKYGFSYDTGYLTIRNTPISKMSFHGGFGIPSALSSSSIDINFEYGKIGTTKNSLIQENIFSVRLVVNLAEFMFYQRKLQ